MNKIKARSKDGKSITMAVQQVPNPTYVSKGVVMGGDWPNSPAAVKARALRMGLVLTGKRQA